jgi:predicted Zn-dependent protease
MFHVEQFLDSLKIDADWIGLREVMETATVRHVRDGKPEDNGRSHTHGVMVEVLDDGCFGYAATNRLDSESIQRAAEKALAQARAARTHGVHRFTESVRPKAAGKYRSPRIKPFDSVSAGDLNDLLIGVCNSLKVSDKIVKTEASLYLVELTSRFVSTNGSDVEQRFNLAITHVSAVAQDGSVIQKRSDHGSHARSFQAGLEVLDGDLTARARRIGEQAVELLTAEECPTETTSLVLAQDQMMLQIHESVGHPLELDRILGDERNYAGSSFVKLSDFGRLQYGSPKMNVTFDPTLSGELASYAFDDLGMKAEKQYLIKEGKLQRALGSLESQVRSGIKGVANSRASSWNRPSIDRMANLNLEPGTDTPEEIIGSVERGVYMESNRSWSIDDYRNKFQFGCEYGKLIENGKMTKTLRNPNYRGITVPFWNSLKKVGNADSFHFFGTPNCGKGEPNQIMWVGHGSPLCLFENVEVFGGAS